MLNSIVKDQPNLTERQIPSFGVVTTVTRPAHRRTALQVLYLLGNYQAYAVVPRLSRGQKRFFSSSNISPVTDCLDAPLARSNHSAACAHSLTVNPSGNGERRAAHQYSCQRVRGVM